MQRTTSGRLGVVADQVVDEVQGAVIGPVDVLDVEHDRVHLETRW
jgi:hypothetical protein